MCKPIVIIPARSGSVGLKNKNIRKIYNLELFLFSVNAARYLGFDYYVFTNDKKIINICKKRNLKYLIRSQENASNKSMDIDFLLEFIRILKLETKKSLQIINFRPSSPLRTKSDLNNFKKIISNSSNSVRSVVKSEFTPYKMWNLNSCYLSPILSLQNVPEPYNQPRQLLPITYQQTGTYDSYLVKDILGGCINGKKIKAFLQESDHTDIDTYKDLVKARSSFKKNKNSFVY